MAKSRRESRSRTAQPIASPGARRRGVPVEQQRVRWFAEGGLAGVLVRTPEKWAVLARFRGEEAERMARDLAAVLEAGGLVRGADLPGPTEENEELF
jgi:hypothetical protein